MMNIPQAIVLVALCISSVFGDNIVSLSLRRADLPVRIRLDEIGETASEHMRAAAVLDIDRSRVREYSRADGTTYTVNMYTNIVEYYAKINVGTPSQMVEVQLDTGSSTLAIPSTTCSGCPGNDYSTDASTTDAVVPCTASGCTQCTGSNCYFKVSYGDGSSIQGSLWTDVVNVGQGLSTNMTFGLIQSASGWENGVGGIWGLAYNSIACTPSCVTTAFDSLVNANLVSNVFSMKIDPQTGGSIDFGGINSASYVGSLQYANVIEKTYYVVNPQNVTVGGTSVGVSMATYGTTIIDSGTTFTIVPQVVYNQFKSLLLQCSNSYFEVLFQTSGGNPLCLLASRVSLSQIIQGVPDIEVTFEPGVKLIWKPEYFVTKAVSSDNQSLYCLGIVTGSDGLTIFGDSFMQAFYVVFDRRSDKVGFAYQKTTTPSNVCTPSTGASISTASSTGDVAVITPSHIMVVLMMVIFALL